MSELGYYEPIPGIYGTANPETDSNPIERAALQEAALQLMILRAEQPGYVPQTYQGNPGVGPSNQQMGGPTNQPIIGWTCQNSTGPAFVEPYTAEDMGRIPDWTGDPNSIGAGRYDQNEVLGGAFAPDRLNVGPIGDSVFGGWEGEPPNPNAPTTDVSGQMGRLEY